MSRDLYPPPHRRFLPIPKMSFPHLDTKAVLTCTTTPRRADVILAKRCAKLQKETGKPHYVDGADHFEGWAHALRVSCSRPLQYLFTERESDTVTIRSGCR